MDWTSSLVRAEIATDGTDGSKVGISHYRYVSCKWQDGDGVRCGEK